MSDRQLQTGRRGVAPGAATSVVVFLHGYGADGADLLDIADVLAPQLPNTAFFAPDAAEPSRNNPFGRQWFPIPWLDGSSDDEARAGMESSVKELNAFLDATLQAEGVEPAALALVGFSQGSMVAMHLAPRRDQAIAGIVAISGRLLVPELLQDEAKVKPPVLLVHGDQDAVVPFADMATAGAALTRAGFATYAHVMKGMGHGISADGLGVTLSFLKDVLPA